jgi:hypothetical protein
MSRKGSRWHPSTWRKSNTITTKFTDRSGTLQTIQPTAKVWPPIVLLETTAIGELLPTSSPKLELLPAARHQPSTGGTKQQKATKPQNHQPETSATKATLIPEVLFRGPVPRTAILIRLVVPRIRIIIDTTGTDLRGSRHQTIQGRDRAFLWPCGVTLLPN